MGTLNSLPLSYLETVADILQVEASVLFLAHSQTLNSYSDNLVLVFIVVYFWSPHYFLRKYFQFNKQFSSFCYTYYY